MLNWSQKSHFLRQVQTDYYAKKTVCQKEAQVQSRCEDISRDDKPVVGGVGDREDDRKRKNK